MTLAAASTARPSASKPAERGAIAGLLPDFLKPRTNAKAPFRVAVILVPGFALMSFASVIEPVRGANRLSGAKHYEWELFAPEGGMVDSNSGITVAAAAVSARAARAEKPCALSRTSRSSMSAASPPNRCAQPAMSMSTPSGGSSATSGV